MLPSEIEVVVREGYHVRRTLIFLSMHLVSVVLLNPQESQYAGKTGVVKAILNRMASIYLYDDGREIDVPCRYVEPVAPNKFDKVS